MRRVPAMTRLLADRSGAGAVEFALLAPLILMVFIGGMYLSMLGFSAASLHYATEAAARCYSVNNTICSNAATTQTFAAARFVNITGNAATFTASTQACGKNVAATVTYKLVAGTRTLNVPLRAAACFP